MTGKPAYRVVEITGSAKNVETYVNTVYDEGWRLIAVSGKLHYFKATWLKS